MPSSPRQHHLLHIWNDYKHFGWFSLFCSSTESYLWLAYFPLLLPPPPSCHALPFPLLSVFFHRSCCYDSGLKTSVRWLFNFTFGADARELLLLFCGLFAYVEWGVMESVAGGALPRRRWVDESNVQICFANVYANTRKHIKLKSKCEERKKTEKGTNSYLLLLFMKMSGK